MSQYFGYRYLSVVMWFVPFIIQVYLLLPPIAWIMSRIEPMIILIAAFLLSYVLIVLVCLHYPEKASEICSTWSPIFRLPEVVLGVYLGMALGGCATIAPLSRLGRGAGGEGVPQQNSEVILGQPLSRHIGFSAGMGLSPFNRLSIIFLPVYAIASFCLLESSSIYAIPNDILALPWGGLIVGIIITFSAVLLFAIFNRTTKLQSFRLLGTASFPFFLIHGVAIRFVYARFGSNILVWLVYYLFCWCAAIILAILDSQLRKHFFRVKERPIARHILTQY